MTLRLEWYEKRCKGKLHEGERVLAAVHAHSAYLTTAWIPKVFYPLFNRHVVVTNERTMVFGPGMWKIIAEYPRGQTNASQTGNYLTIGNERLFVDTGVMVGPLKRIVDEVVQSANGL